MNQEPTTGRLRSELHEILEIPMASYQNLQARLLRWLMAGLLYGVHEAISRINHEVISRKNLEVISRVSDTL